MIHYNFYSVCCKETEDSPIDLDPENDPLNSKGCPQFCPKEPTLLLESKLEEIKSNIEKTQYDICNVQLEDNKMIIDLHKFFEGSDPEKQIIPQIPIMIKQMCTVVNFLDRDKSDWGTKFNIWTQT